MDRRTAESPMDFEWQSRGPVDPNSPFNLGAHDKKRSYFTGDGPNDVTPRKINPSDKPPGTHSVFDSPAKPQLPSLRQPNSQPFLFTQPRQSAPLSPKAKFGQPAFTTPRKFEVDFSSGPENMSSPECADNEDTPDQPSKTGKSSSHFSFLGRSSPGRGGIPRLTHHSNAIQNRVQKRRRRDQELGRTVRIESDDESELDQPNSRENRTGKAAKKGRQQEAELQGSRVSTWSEFFSMLEAHPNVPAILSWWAQLVVNLSLFSLAVYVVFGFVSAIRGEFEQAAQEMSDTILADMAVCTKSYVDNDCGRPSRAPALETICENWERCMNRDPAKVGRAKVSAHTMAIIINSFIDPISWKAILFFLATISTVTVVSNWSFRSFRHRLQQQHYEQHPPQPQPMHPQLHHNPAFGYYGQDPRQTQDMNYGEKQDPPMLLENTKSMDFVTERSRDREQHLRTPSPTKRRFA
ncbi:hypothetical protein PENARI_c003G12037 [Penicillium arizonense]|uniref:Brl1/Brr6 domain-containing protein n=1 Tax=Penicillium arizonense TaxID=1835702 RepID=A0A1F5LSP1_PENAI|nr:hypothetical protein PENARI_c003G12037 [Penicillium arizonense]OGE56050.1 hypothetical protein PENARI_c003G12037 [Penicillium arizonense]